MRIGSGKTHNGKSAFNSVCFPMCRNYMQRLFKQAVIIQHGSLLFVELLAAMQALRNGRCLKTCSHGWAVRGEIADYPDQDLF